MKLSDLNPEEVKVVEPAPSHASSASLKLSALHPTDVKAIPDAPVEPTSLASDAGDLGLGVAHGASFGLAPKGEAALRAGIDKLRGSVSGEPTKDYGDIYKQYQDLVQKRYDDAKARSPYLYGAGEIGGAIGTTALTGGLSAEAGLGARLAQGAIAGGAYGLGESKGDLTTNEGVEQAGRDILGGAATGAALTGAGEAIIPAVTGAVKGAGKAIVSKVSQAAEESPVFQKMSMAFKHGLEGKGFVGQEAETALQNQLSKESGGMANKLVSARNNASQEVGKVLDSAPEILDPSDIIDSAKGQLKQLAKDQRTVKLSRDYDRLNSSLNNIKRTTSVVSPADMDLPIDRSMTAKELFDSRNMLRDLKQDMTDPDILKIADGALKQIDGKLAEVPGYIDSMNVLKEYSSKGPETFLPKTLQKYGAKGEEVLASKLQQSAQRAAGSPAQDTSVQARHQIQEFIDNINAMKAEKPGMLESLGIDNPEEMISNLRKTADLEQVRKQINQPGVEGIGSLFNPIKIPGNLAKIAKLGNYNPEAQMGSTLLKANQLGQAGKAVSNVVTDFGNKLYNATPETLQNIGSVLKQQGVALGDTLIKSIRENNEATKNAVIFSILQRPDLRNMLTPAKGNE